MAGGAYVYGQIRTEGLENITIRGRGIISGSIYDRLSVSQYTIPIEIRSSKNIKIEDLTFLDPAGWTIALYKSKDVVLNNVKIISARQMVMEFQFNLVKMFLSMVVLFVLGMIHWS